MFWFQAGARAVVSRIACEDADGLERVAARSVHSGRPAGIAVANLGSGVEGAANLGSADIVVWGLFGRCAERIDHQAEILGDRAYHERWLITHRTATINGTVRSDGYLVANIAGPNVSCQGVIVGWSAAPPPGGG